MIDQVSGEELQDVLVAEGFPPDQIKIADAYYALPTEEAIKDFGKRLGKFLFNSGLDQWVEEIWDCDDFAFTAKSMAAIDNAIWKKTTGNDSSLAFGICWVTTKEGGHAINLAVYRDAQGKLKVHYYEPQMGVQDKIGDPFVWLQEKSRDYFVSPFWCYF